MSASAPTPTLQTAALLAFLAQLAVLLLTATVLGRVAGRFGLPSVVGELSAGLLLGPSMLSTWWPELTGVLVPEGAAQLHLLDVVGQLGVLLLVGITGCHVDLALVRRRGWVAAAVSGFGLVVPLVLGVALGFVLPGGLIADRVERPVFAAFLGIALCVSAVPVIAKVFADLGALHRDTAQLTLAAGLIDDAVGWALLSLVTAAATAGLTWGTALSGVGALLLVMTVTAFVVRPVARAAFRVAGRTGDATVTIATAVVLILACSAGTASVHLEAVMGAFLAGIVIGEWGRPDPVLLAPLRTVTMSVLAPVFFASCGLRVDLAALLRPDVALTAVVVLVVAVAGKFLGAFLGARVCGLGGWQALALGAGMNARGVVEIIIATVGLRLRIIGPEIYTVIVLVAVVTSLMAPPLLARALTRLPVNDVERERERAHRALLGARPVAEAGPVTEAGPPVVEPPSRAA